jgi:hypothetical protein
MERKPRARRKSPTTERRRTKRKLASCIAMISFFRQISPSLDRRFARDGRRDCRSCEEGKERGGEGV